MNEGLLILATFLGALGSGTAGWWDSHEPFDARKFMGTVWRAVFGAMLAYSSSAIPAIKESSGISIYIGAFLVGAGVDAFGNRIQGGLTQRLPDRLTQLQNQVKELCDLFEKTITKLTQERVHQPPPSPASSPTEVK